MLNRDKRRLELLTGSGLRADESSVAYWKVEGRGIRYVGFVRASFVSGVCLKQGG